MPARASSNAGAMRSIRSAWTEKSAAYPVAAPNGFTMTRTRSGSIPQVYSVIHVMLIRERRVGPVLNQRIKPRVLQRLGVRDRERLGAGSVLHRLHFEHQAVRVHLRLEAELAAA